MGALATLASEVRGSRNSSGDLTCRFPRVCPNTLFACVAPASSCGDSHEHHVPALCSAVDLLRRSAQTLNPLWDGFADCTEERWANRFRQIFPTSCVLQLCTVDCSSRGSPPMK